jgi:hypothetical protein
MFSYYQFIKIQNANFKFSYIQYLENNIHTLIKMSGSIVYAILTLCYIAYFICNFVAYNQTSYFKYLIL